MPEQQCKIEFKRKNSITFKNLKSLIKKVYNQYKKSK